MRGKTCLCLVERNVLEKSSGMNTEGRSRESSSSGMGRKKRKYNEERNPTTALAADAPMLVLHRRIRKRKQKEDIRNQQNFRSSRRKKSRKLSKLSLSLSTQKCNTVYAMCERSSYACLLRHVGVGRYSKQEEIRSCCPSRIW